MICTSVKPCLSSGLNKNDKIMSMFIILLAFMATLKVWLFCENGGTNLTLKQSKRCFWSKRYISEVTTFKKVQLYILTKM